MAIRKWGESFLKSGLPLEHLTAVTLRSLGWQIEPNIEYSRKFTEQADKWFELDMFTTCPEMNGDTELGFLIECKYHDASRFWMLLPCEDVGWKFDDAVLNCGPIQTLRHPRRETFLSLAPMSSLGVVISKDGTKQDNAIHTAMQQLANAFVPYSADRMWDFNFEVRHPHKLPWATAMVPMIVTNASIFRLKPEITDLEIIRNASSPSDIADELDWTWCNYSVPVSQYEPDFKAMERHAESLAGRIKRFPPTGDRLHDFLYRPHWLAVVNIRALVKVAELFKEHFMSLQTVSVKSAIKSRMARKPIGENHLNSR